MNDIGNEDLHLFNIYDNGNLCQQVNGCRNLQKTLTDFWVYNHLSENHNFTIKDCGKKQTHDFDEIYGCNIEHNYHNHSNKQSDDCCEDCLTCENHLKFIGD